MFDVGFFLEVHGCVLAAELLDEEIDGSEDYYDSNRDCGCSLQCQIVSAVYLTTTVVDI